MADSEYRMDIYRSVKIHIWNSIEKSRYGEIRC